jgi:hypothetical protein
MRVKSSFSAWLGSLALIAIALVGTRQTFLALQSPGHAIRRELTAAGAEMGQLSWSTPTESVRQSIEHRFARYHVKVNPAGFPAYVTVTLHGLSREACFDAERAARRVEGSVVIAIEGQSVPEDCDDNAELTWRIMP